MRVLLAAALCFSPISAFADVLSSCEDMIEAEYPSSDVDAGKAGCACLAEAVAGDAALESEVLNLIDMSRSDRADSASDEKED